MFLSLKMATKHCASYWPLSSVSQRTFIDLLHHHCNDSLTHALYQSFSCCAQLDCLLVVRCMESMCTLLDCKWVALVNVTPCLKHPPAIAVVLKNLLIGHSLERRMIICVHLYTILSMNKVKFNLLYCMLEHFGD